MPSVAVLETRRCLLSTKWNLIPDLDKPEEAVVGLNEAAPVLEDIVPTSAFYTSLGFLGF